jgi:hypothetical protein
MDLEPVQPPDGWDAALQGSRGGLTATLLFQRTPKPGVQFTFNFSFDSTQSVADQVAATSTLVALHGKGKLDIYATDGSRPEPLTLATSTAGTCRSSSSCCTACSPTRACSRSGAA